MRVGLTIFIIFCCAVPVLADELHLSNGDIINGQLIRLEEKKLLFKTVYAGEIHISWPEVTNLITDVAIRVVLDDGTFLEGFARKTSVNMMRLETEKLEAPSDFKLSDVAAINPVKKPVVKITVRTNVGLTQDRGNTDANFLRLEGEFSARTEKNRYTFMGDLNKESSEGKTTVENWLAFGVGGSGMGQ